MSIDKSVGRLRADKLMPGVTLDRVKENTSFELAAAPELVAVDPPTEMELRILREQVDPDGLYLKSAE